MENGQITQAGTYDKLLKAGTAFEQLVNAHKSSITILKSIDHQTQTGKQRTTRDLESVGSNSLRQNSDAEILFKAISTVQLTEDEEKEIGDLGWEPYKDYLYVSKGSFFLTLVICAQSSFVILQCLSTYWLAIGVQISNISSAILVGVYAALSIISCSFTYFRSYFAAHLGLRASRAFFTGLMDSVFKAPMLFFDSTPVGRILTRVRPYIKYSNSLVS